MSFIVRQVVQVRQKHGKGEAETKEGGGGGGEARTTTGQAGLDAVYEA